MIKELIEEVDNETKEIIKRLNRQAILSVIVLDTSKGNEMYLKSIKKKAKELEVEVEVEHGVKRALKLSRNVLILKPEGSEILYYNELKEQLKHIDIEGDSQRPTIKATTHIIDRLSEENLRDDMHVLVMNRSKDLGIPLAKELLERDYTVTISHSKSRLYDYREYDLIVTATGVNQDNLYNKVTYHEGMNNWWVDIGYDISPDKDNDRLIRNVGGLTTSYLFNEVVKRQL